MNQGLKTHQAPESSRKKGTSPAANLSFDAAAKAAQLPVLPVQHKG